jgi:hypothetical protein
MDRGRLPDVVALSPACDLAAALITITRRICGW